MSPLQLIGVLEIGLIYAIVAIAVFVTFRIIDFPDLTVDGSFTLGAAVSAAMIAAGYNPYFATICAIFAGSIAGCVTGYLNVKWKILGLLAGILTMTALYSINLRIMQKPNIAIIDEPTIFGHSSVIPIGCVVIVLLITFLTKFFATDFGLSIRAVGINEKVSTAYGVNVNVMKIVALSISNAVVALAGSLFTQSQGFADISMGAGTVIVGLAAVIIGETLVHPKKIIISLVTCVFGSIAYRLAIAFALNADNIGLEASDLNMISAVLVAMIMRFSKSKP